ncbi:hypothetical protein MMC17_004468 [Xylographa soralifera]|nr:hypothetical protein [Xylographa soralifera]
MDPEANNIPVPKSQKPRGDYASLSQFIASDKTLCIFRRFDALAIRKLLYMQDELCEIEQQLGELDKADMASKVYVDLYSLHSRRFDKNEKRIALMQKAAETLRSYEKALLRHSNLLALGKPSESNVTSLSNWMSGKNPTAEEESHFLDLRSDLSPLLFQENQRNFLETFLERHCYKLFVTSVSSNRKNLDKELTFI